MFFKVRLIFIFAMVVNIKLEQAHQDRKTQSLLTKNKMASPPSSGQV